MTVDKNIPQSWGHYPRVEPDRVIPVFWRDELPNLSALDKPLLPFGYGRSYGDSCLNEGGIILDTTHLKRFLAFDSEQGILRCEAGVSFAEILELVVPHGWFLPVSPGTKFVSIGGAVANDVHGKNHHRGGTFGCHVTQFELLRSNGDRLICSPEENSEMFSATIGGLGLTGLILWVEFRLKAIRNPYIKMESIRFSSLKEFMDLAEESDEDFEHTVSWIDCLASGEHLGRGLFNRGNHLKEPLEKPLSKKLALTVPIDFPSWTLNAFTVKAFNTAYYNKQLSKVVKATVPYEPFFYPLDSIYDWNRIYGQRGFFQYQCVVPFENGYENMKEILGRISRSGQGTFLVVLKTFGHRRSPGMMSFPRPGITLALDFANQGRRTLRLMEALDSIVRRCHGAVYPGKDARMSPESFNLYYPQWREFAKYIDPKFSSSFWRRVTTGLDDSVEGAETYESSNYRG
jgi:FAD/FMN-containing dehydrogenase